MLQAAQWAVIRCTYAEQFRFSMYDEVEDEIAFLVDSSDPLSVYILLLSPWSPVICCLVWLFGQEKQSMVSRA